MIARICLRRISSGLLEGVDRTYCDSRSERHW
jgi:hypothetical protein